MGWGMLGMHFLQLGDGNVKIKLEMLRAVAQSHNILIFRVVDDAARRFRA